jgi:hypothetical protein
MTEGVSTECEWCERPFRVRRGGSPQRFCGTTCRTAFWSALRRWGERAIATGVLTVADIRNGDPAACTLLAAVGSPETVGEAYGGQSSAVARRADSHYTAQLDLERLMARAIAMRRR